MACISQNIKLELIFEEVQFKALCFSEYFLQNSIADLSNIILSKYELLKASPEVLVAERTDKSK